MVMNVKMYSDEVFLPRFMAVKPIDDVEIEEVISVQFLDSRGRVLATYDESTFNTNNRSTYLQGKEWSPKEKDNDL